MFDSVCYVLGMDVVKLGFFLSVNLNVVVKVSGIVDLLMCLINEV